MKPFSLEGPRFFLSSLWDGLSVLYLLLLEDHITDVDLTFLGCLFARSGILTWAASRFCLTKSTTLYISSLIPLPLSRLVHDVLTWILSVVFGLKLMRALNPLLVYCCGRGTRQ